MVAATLSTGQRFDSETGLYHYRARYYMPGIGRFLQADPVGYEAGMNLYAYCVNDPMDHTDPDGLEPENLTLASWKRILFRFDDFKGPDGKSHPRPAALSLKISFDLASGEMLGKGIQGIARTYIGSLKATLKDPAGIEFSQNNVSGYIRTPNGKQSITDGINELKAAKKDLPPIKVYANEAGTQISIDNRRLLMYKAANRAIPTVPLSKREFNLSPNVDNPNGNNQVGVRYYDPEK